MTNINLFRKCWYSHILQRMKTTRPHDEKSIIPKNHLGGRGRGAVGKGCMTLPAFKRCLSTTTQPVVENSSSSAWRPTGCSLIYCISSYSIIGHLFSDTKSPFDLFNLRDTAWKCNSNYSQLAWKLPLKYFFLEYKR